MLSYDALNAEVSFTLHIEARRGTSDLSWETIRVVHLHETSEIKKKATNYEQN
jgi:hypothetical protein